MPRFIGRFKGRISIATFLSSGGLEGSRREQHPIVLAGWTEAGEGETPKLCDQSGEWSLPAAVAAALTGTCWLALRLSPDEGPRIIYSQPIAGSAESDRLRRLRGRLLARGRIHTQVRAFFAHDGFLEVDTPVAVPCPGMEPFLDTFAAGPLYLRTSPELHMKRLLAGGFDKVFQIGPCFRAGDRGRHHREEFLMLEWYRLFADLDDIAGDIRALLAHLAPLAMDPDYYLRPAQVVSCRVLFARYLDLDLIDQCDGAPLRRCLTQRGIPHDVDDDWDTLFFLLFLNFIEPHLGVEAPCLVVDYPARQAALAKTAPTGLNELPTCYRMELYAGGMELANAFYELTDPEEQRRRFEADRDLRRRLGKPAYPADEGFLAALDSGLPPAAGIALGLDRLTAALLGLQDLGDLLPFGEAEE